MTNRSDDPIVIVGHAIRLPGGVNSVADFERLLFDGRSAIDRMPAGRFDRELYFDSNRGVAGKAYTEFGGCVSASPLDDQVEQRIEALGTFDLTHRQFAQVAVRAWQDNLSKVIGIRTRCGVFVGHSGGTDQGGPLAMAGLAEIAIEQLHDVDEFKHIARPVANRLASRVQEKLRQDRPVRNDDSVRFNAYSAASLVGRLLGLDGPREVIDAACASSLLGLSHAVASIRRGRIDAAIVGGATYNNIDNLILFSQSQACSDQGSCPFDKRAGGLISSEGYVAIAITRQSIALANELDVLGELCSVGVASDGRGKSLWAPRTEGQQLAIRRGYSSDKPLSIDYLEAHATSTQVGDATEIQSLSELLESSGHQGTPLLVGSVKSNLGHTLEAAGLVGLVKLLIAMRREAIPPTINFVDPSPEVAVASRIQIVSKAKRWPSTKATKRCAVNAFGIGGLNGHAVIQSWERPDTVRVPPLSSHRMVTEKVGTSNVSDEPIAIVGRGLVLPGAFNVAEFRTLLASGRTVIAPAPADRWLNSVGVSDREAPFNVPTSSGGFIENYRFDGQPYRIPPKQVQLANPVQMMLIDAVAQASHEADGGRWAFDRQRTSVIIGTIFGGEFSNQLQVGLRLPEICLRIEEELLRSGESRTKAAEISTAYRKWMLKKYPALLDETGSFTASTLASRIAKSFDLMGGACAVDSDDASGSLALMLAADQLRSGETDAVICGVAQRSLDIIAFKDLQLRDRLVHSGTAIDIPEDCSKVLPGEGVSVLLLRRLSDAKKAGSQILGLIDDFDCGTKPNAMAFRHGELAKDRINCEIVRRVGYLAGAHSIVRLIAETIRWEASKPVSTRINATAEDGFYISTTVRHPKTEPPLASGKYNEALISANPSSTWSDSRNALPSSMNAMNNEAIKILCLEGVDERDFEARLRTVVESPENAIRNLTSVTELSYSHGARFRGGIVANSFRAVASSAAALLKAWEAGKRSTVLDRELAIVWDRAIGNDRIAWAFPGQGAQYSAVPQVVNEDSFASSFLERFDSMLKKAGLKPVSDRLSDPDQQLGLDVWWTQLWVLAVSATLADSLGRSGQQPDVVFGHSFGECGAAVHAGVMSLPQAIRFAKQRSDAVVMTNRNRGQLLSVRGTPSRVDAVLASLGLDLCITHHNAPEQTVVAGTSADIAVAKATLASKSMASVVIPVPAPFHSPALEDARRRLKIGFGDERLRPPRISFFSAMQGRYLAESDEIRDGLVNQLTQPLLYCGAVERLVRDGYGLIVDVGPSDMLTRLHRATVGSNAICVSLDNGENTHSQRIALVALASQCVASSPMVSRIASDWTHIELNNESTTSLEEMRRQTSSSTEVDFEIIDVTRRSRSKMSATEPLQDSDVPVDQPELNGLKTQGVSQPAVQVNAVQMDSSMIDRFLIDTVVELTGYSADVIDFDADLEAELGIDSIKKAQVIGELAEWASVELDLRKIKLSQFRSLGDIRSLAVASPDAIFPIHTPTLAVVKNFELPNPRAIVGNQAELAVKQQNVAGNRNGHVCTVSAATKPSIVVGQLESLMVDFIVDQTGYSPDVVDMDADLEGELGLDSIKKAQLLGELVSHYDLSSVDLRRIRLASFPTLATIRDFVLEHVPGSAIAFETDLMLDSEQVSSELESLPAKTNIFDDTVKKKRVRHSLRTLIDSPTQDLQSDLVSLFRDDELVEIRQQGADGLCLAAIAKAAGVASAPLWYWLQSGAAPKAIEQGHRPIAIPAAGTCRFGLVVDDQPRRVGMPTELCWQGNALVVGKNSLAEGLCKRLVAAGLMVTSIDDLVRADALESILGKVWGAHETPHLFITTPHDKAAIDCFSTSQWRKRREAALMVPFRVCQLWLQRMIDSDLMAKATLVSTLNAGGDFGFSTTRLAACESGGIAGLTKAMLIESWMRGFRETPMKVIDIAPETSIASAIDGIFRELAVPSHDEEVVVDGTKRWSVRPRYMPLELDGPRDPHSKITRGGTWIVSGGGRGITALTSMALAEKYALVLHLLGTAPVPSLDSRTRQRAVSDRQSLRREVMAAAQQSGQNPIERWRDTEKAIEIDQTLAECERRGIVARYHCVDVSDATAVKLVVDRIREQVGPIRGVIHGAGAGQDARFDRKRLDKVEKCIRAKVDGGFALAEATKNDPLEWFVGFGSISGRFGANGHTDYSLANDMLAKVIGRLRQQRPEVACVTFHWHAWGDIGMATKPEAKLALEMIGMEFMPAEEGLAHFLNELEHGGDMSEVLITDRNYIRKFFPGFGHDSPHERTLPLLDPSAVKASQQDENSSWAVTLDPVTDRFLSEHLVGGMPTLPFVIAIEMMAEAAGFAKQRNQQLVCRDVKVFHPIKFSSNDAMAVELVREAGSKANAWRLQADLRRRDGRVVELGLVRFRATFEHSSALVMPTLLKTEDAVSEKDFRPIEYLGPDGPVYHGESFQCLRSIAVHDGVAIGKIMAPSPVQLGGVHRPAHGWVIPVAAMDAMLYASAVLAYSKTGRGSLPVRFDAIHVGRLPDPGEPLTVVTRVSETNKDGMSLDADLIGLNRDHILALRGYHVSWLQ